MNKNEEQSEFVFTKHDEIGSAAAEDDERFLTDCFIDNGDLNALTDISTPKRIIVGRTGAGKSALITEIEQTQKNCIELSLNSLSLNFIANNNVISFFEEVGLNLAPFYALLWKHVLVVELLKSRFNINSENAQKIYMKQMRRLFVGKDKNKEMAIDYLEKWGHKFWLTTEKRVEEITENIENNLTSAIKGELPGASINLSGAKKLTQEEKSTVIERGRKTVSDIQIRELENIITVMGDDIFNDEQNIYFVTIDGLDEEWVDDRIKLSLIKSLIDTVRKFKRIPTIKIILAMRDDLLDKVIHHTRETGFQEEKYKSLYLDLSWSASELEAIIDKRINFLIKRRYTKDNVGFHDVFPEKVGGEKTIKYLTDRTFLRPRDIIIFVNECIRKSAQKSKITPTTIKEAESKYSYERLQSLATEWLGIYPNLFAVTQIFENQKCRISVSQITQSFLQNGYINIIDQIDLPEENCPLTRLLRSIFDDTKNFNSVRNTFLRELYITGFIGIKVNASSPVSWSYQAGYGIAPGQVKANSMVYIHPTFHKSLSIHTVQ